MGIVDGFTFCVMFTVDSSPLASILCRGQPQPETEEVFQTSVELQGAVGRIAVQIDRDADNGHVGHQQGDRHCLPG